MQKQYVSERDQIAATEHALGEVTTSFAQSEAIVVQLEDVATTWRIALHAMKMELLRLAKSVERCNGASRPRRPSADEASEILVDDDHYDGKGGKSILSALQISNRVMGRWERRNSDPEISGLPLVDVRGAPEVALLGKPEAAA